MAIMKMQMQMNASTPENIIMFNALEPRLGLMVLKFFVSMAYGRAPALILSDKFFAAAYVSMPLITAFPPVILSCTTGLEISSSSM